MEDVRSLTLGLPTCAFAVGHALTSESGTEATTVTSQLAELLERPDLPSGDRLFLTALQSILSGSRDPALASDPALSYDAAAEIVLLLEALG